MRRLLLAIGLALPLCAQLNVSGNIVRFLDAGTAVIVTAGDSANNALRVNVVALVGGAGTSSAFGAAFPAAGTAAGFNDGTNMQGAKVFDLDSGAGFDRVLGANLRRTANGGSVELIAQQAMADSIPVVIANNQSAFAVTVSGTVTADQGAANAAPWFVRYVPLHGCAGNVLQDITQVDVAIGPGGSALTAATTCVFKIYVNNKTANNVTVTLQDAGAPVNYSNTFVLTGYSDRFWDFGGMKFLTGVTMIAGTAASLNARLIGIQ
jgi:hypothetical protein